MSIVTRTGDDGSTGLMYGRRVTKSHPRIAACGAIDELNAALGLARAEAGGETLLPIQKELVGVMGELATLDEDMPRYIKDGYPVISVESVARLDQLAATLETSLPPFKDWVMPGANRASATIDFARTICRRAERHISELELHNAQILIYLNRLSDVLWLMARSLEK
ncbi:MAG TPA: cob(I)yrinic acid a,c-diamide adenosyltransferase [Verrucomicrobiae bacterium]|nr:cob(I)yrinic acid a,c-diamide adenosyltransferase [Verrucomicrobiae bacterium]